MSWTVGGRDIPIMGGKWGFETEKGGVKADHAKGRNARNVYYLKKNQARGKRTRNIVYPRFQKKGSQIVVG